MTNQQKHNAGRYLAAGEAWLHGYKATVVDPRTFIQVNGHKAQVQVATQGAWQIEDVFKYTSATIEHIVLVDLTGDRRDFYICPGDELRSDVRQRFDEFLSRNAGQRPRNPDSTHAAVYPTDVQKWQNNWSRLAPR